MNFSEKLQSLRRIKGYSQEFLAEKCGVSRQAISKWETGIAYPEMDKLICLSKIYDVTIDYLVKDKFQEKGKINEEIKKSDYSQYIGKFCDLTMKSLIKTTYRNVKIISCDQEYVFFIRKGKKGLANKKFVHSVMVKNRKHEHSVEKDITYGINLLKNMMGKCNIYANPNGYFGGATYLLAEIKAVEGNTLKASVGKHECSININEISSIFER
ncbi:helix-turn-helix domain-containing protein [Clostridium estertheticum]|uniref:helix-turn-helix domain-containing protein n=1 Tax=Clostridium estertheticum TaxID=238834 RepID=UPI001C0D887F|nr:helix-turn-helix transcriptional regulator [Clostridium estertheticum]MBU3187282.1 helix-turn-helix domain-containing protein [Clostridium estertheticum]